MPPLDSIAAFHEDMTAWRRDIHAHPELGFEEQRTSDVVAQKLEEFGIEVTRGIGKTGLVGRLKDEMHGAVEIARSGEIACRAQEHRRVPVMAAGVHLARVLRAMREAVGFKDR